MIIKQSIGEGEVRQINQSGKHIKVVDCEGDLQVRAFLENGALALDTTVKSGFSVDFAGFFAYLTVQSERAQKYVVWVSDKKLSYEPPAASSNRLNNSLVSHYGDVEQVAAFESGRVALSIYSEHDFFLGGENVTIDNGLPMAAGKVHRVETGAPIYVALNVPADQKIKSAEFAISKADFSKSGQSFRDVHIVDGKFMGLTTASSAGKLAVFGKDGWYLDERVGNYSGNNFKDLAIFDSGLLAWRGDYNGVWVKYKSGLNAKIATAPTSSKFSATGDWYCMFVYKDSESAGFYAVNVKSAQVVEFDFTEGSLHSCFYHKGLNKFFFVSGKGLFTAEGQPSEWGGVMPEVEKVSEGKADGVNQAGLSENAGYIVAAGGGGAYIIDKASMNIKFNHEMNVIWASRDGRLKAFRENGYYVSDDGGVIWLEVLESTGLNLPFNNRNYNVYEKAGEFWVLPSGSGAVVYSFVAEKERINKKASVVVMRELV